MFWRGQGAEKEQQRGRYYTRPLTAALPQRGKSKQPDPGFKKKLRERKNAVEQQAGGETEEEEDRQIREVWQVLR